MTTETRGVRGAELRSALGIRRHLRNARPIRALTASIYADEAQKSATSRTCVQVLLEDPSVVKHGDDLQG